MKIDIETLEHHHNALQIYFNLLLLSLAKHQPEVVDNWLADLQHALDSEPAIPEKQRELMQSQCLAFAEHAKNIKHQGKPL